MHCSLLYCVHCTAPRCPVCYLDVDTVKLIEACPRAGLGKPSKEPAHHLVVKTLEEQNRGFETCDLSLSAITATPWFTRRDFAHGNNFNLLTLKQ
jgi:hypothetical protein